ncbi:MAG: cyclic nucleotide-binding domain-containing protein [Acidimicrobiia bacterium]|jgi:CRP-like cAMP-binding protein
MARRDDNSALLAQVPLFSACSKKELQQIARRAEERRVEAGTAIVREGAAGDAFYVIVSGQAEVDRSGDVVATIGPGSFFGDLALLDKAPRNATVTAKTDMELIVLNQHEFSVMLDEAGGFARKLLVGLAHRLREMDAQTRH